MYTKRGANIYVTYTFIVDNNLYRGTDQLEKPPTESAVKVVYDPNNPEVNQIVGGREFFSYVQGFIGAVLAGLLLGLVSLVINALRR